MMRVQQLIKEFRGRSDLTVDEEKHAWRIRIPKGNAFVCEVTVPQDRFEWFASVKHIGDQKEAWSDWMEHYGSPDQELDAEMASCIAAFVERVVKSELRLPLHIYEEAPSKPPESTAHPGSCPSGQ